MDRMRVRTAVWLLLLPAAFAMDRPKAATPPREVSVVLLARAAEPGMEVVNFGVPLPPGFLGDPRKVRAFREDDSELEIAARSLEPWRMDGREGTIRSLQIQFRADFSQHPRQQVRITFDTERADNDVHFVPVEETLVAADGLKGPRVLAILPAKWLCDSWIVGPQVPAAESGAYKDYDRLVENNFPGSLQYIASTQYDHWLFDRTTCWYKMYVRTGEQKFL